MHVLALQVALRLPGVRSLKEKRSLLRPIIDGGRHRFPVAIAEVDHQDAWQLATIGISGVSASPSRLAQQMDEVERFVWSFPAVEVLSADRHWLDIDR